MTMMMTADVWQSYPGEGDELLLALALADQAADDGTVFIDNPSFLMYKCRLTTERYATLWMHMLTKGVLVSKDGPDDREDEYQFVFRR